MDNKIISMLLKKLIDRADEVDSDELMGAMSHFGDDDADDKGTGYSDAVEAHKEPDGDEVDDDEESLKLLKLFKD